jgi:hypothetical protein
MIQDIIVYIIVGLAFAKTVYATVVFFLSAGKNKKKFCSNCAHCPKN